MKRQTSFFTESLARIFTGQYWFACAFCPRKQFAYAATAEIASQELQRQGWRTSPHTCPKCARERG